MNNLNFKKLREDLINYFGTAMFMVSPIAMFDVEKVRKASNEELIKIAIKNHFDLSKYKV